MNVSAHGLAALISHEAIVTRRYKDSVAVWTVGVGHTKSAGAPDPMTITTDQPVATLLEIFTRDAAKFADRVTKAVTVDITQYEFDALFGFDFNTGAVDRASLTKSLNAGDRAKAVAQFMNWVTPSEIIDRRKAEMILFRDGIYDGGGKASVYPATDSGAVLWSKGERVDVLSLLETAGAAPALVPAATRPVLRRPMKGPDVAAWQAIVGVTADGDFGPKTETATRAWQKAHGLVADGVVGRKTWASVGVS